MVDLKAYYHSSLEDERVKLYPESLSNLTGASGLKVSPGEGPETFHPLINGIQRNWKKFLTTSNIALHRTPERCQRNNFEVTWVVYSLLK